ncbi:MAG: hypothetical protein WCS43_03735 [Verrucomicrobiota bacterium]
MPSSNQDDTLLLIRCPSCGQRFKVGEDLRERTVECGGCEHRFKIQDDVIVRGKKFYPGERHDPGLNRFQRVPMAVQTPMEGVNYQSPPDSSIFEPTSPQRVIAGVAGGAWMVLVVLILILGASQGGMLDGVITQNRVVMAGFSGLLGILLLVYGNPKARVKALGLGLLMATAMVSLPFFFTDGSIPQERGAKADFSAFDPKVSESSIDETDETRLRELIGTQPLETEIRKLAEKSSTKHAMGIWLRDLRQQNRILIRDYIQRVTGVSQAPHFFPRGNGDFLLLVSETDFTLEDVKKFAASLGDVVNTHTRMSVIEVKVNNASFVGAPVEKLTDVGSPAFYDLNMKELDSIDLDRVAAAVRRLAQSEPKVYRTDISRRLIRLLGTDWITFKGDVCSALSVWSEKPGPAGDMALVQAKVLFEKKADVPKDMINLIVKEKNAGVIPILNWLWKGKPTEWERPYGDLEALAEPSLIQCFSSTEGGLRQSAVRLLGRVGGAASLPVLEGATGSADSEMKVLIEKATTSIRSRTGQ